MQANNSGANSGMGLIKRSIEYASKAKSRFTNNPACLKYIHCGILHDRYPELHPMQFSVSQTPAMPPYLLFFSLLPYSKSKSSNFSLYLRIFLLIFDPSTQVT